jgi:hypothetical protein
MNLKIMFKHDFTIAIKVSLLSLKPKYCLPRQGDGRVHEMGEEYLCILILAVLQNTAGHSAFIAEFNTLTFRSAENSL